MNKIILVGRLAKDPVKKVLEESGNVVTRFIIATERPYRNAEGVKEADFIPVAVWGKKAEIISNYMEKGKMISISGRLETRTFIDKEGNKKFISEVIADDFQFLSYPNKKAEKTEETEGTEETAG